MQSRRVWVRLPKWIMLAASVLAGSRGASARDILYGQARETVPVAFGAETLFRFPQEVKTVTEASRFEIRPANSDQPDYSMLVVKPRFSEGASDVTFLLADGTEVKTQLAISTRTNLHSDRIYDFKPKEDLSQTNPNRKSRSDPMVISELDLMRAMLRNDTISGFKIEAYSKPIALGSSHLSGHLSAELKLVYRGHDMNGYIYLLTTDFKNEGFEVNLDGLAIGQPNLAILAQVDRHIIGGRAPDERRAYLRVVARPGAYSQQILLPVSLRSEKRRSEEKSE